MVGTLHRNPSHRSSNQVQYATTIDNDAILLQGPCFQLKRKVFDVRRCTVLKLLPNMFHVWETNILLYNIRIFFYIFLEHKSSNIKNWLLQQKQYYRGQRLLHDRVSTPSPCLPVSALDIMLHEVHSLVSKLLRPSKAARCSTVLSAFWSDRIHLQIYRIHLQIYRIHLQIYRYTEFI